ncbi:MAG: protein kinase [Caenibius sp.]
MGDGAGSITPSSQGRAATAPGLTPSQSAEFVKKADVVRWMHDHPAPELSQVRDVIRQIASGLQALHRREMIHRDLRPRECLIDRNGTSPDH